MENHPLIKCAKLKPGSLLKWSLLNRALLHMQKCHCLHKCTRRVKLPQFGRLLKHGFCNNMVGSLPKAHWPENTKTAPGGRTRCPGRCKGPVELTLLLNWAGTRSQTLSLHYPPTHPDSTENMHTITLGGMLSNRAESWWWWWLVVDVRKEGELGGGSSGLEDLQFEVRTLSPLPTHWTTLTRGWPHFREKFMPRR